MPEVIRIEGDGAKRLQNALNNLQGKVGKVGWFEKSKYPSENGRPAVPVAMVAAINEFGSPGRNIPPRPFMRTTITAKQNEWACIAESQAKRILDGRSTVNEAMEILGSTAAGEIRETISQIFSPPLKSSTIKNRVRQMAKKNVVGNLDKPLVFTGLLRTTLTNTVESL